MSNDSFLCKLISYGQFLIFSLRPTLYKYYLIVYIVFSIFRFLICKLSKYLKFIISWQPRALKYGQSLLGVVIKVLAQNLKLLILCEKCVIFWEPGKKINDGLLDFRHVCNFFQILNRKRSIIHNEFMWPVIFYFENSFYDIAISNELNWNLN